MQGWLGKIGDPGSEHKEQNKVAQEGPLDIVLFLLIWEVKHIKAKCDYM